jgi:hypothetical protein
VNPAVETSDTWARLGRETLVVPCHVRFRIMPDLPCAPAVGKKWRSWTTRVACVWQTASFLRSQARGPKGLSLKERVVENGKKNGQLWSRCLVARGCRGSSLGGDHTRKMVMRAL